jgi:general secretion pathway protein F
MSQGESLSQALEAEGDRIPRLYRSVVEAGIRGGRLSVALEGLAGYARGYAESRRVVGLALWYPLIVLSLTFVLFIVLVTGVVPQFQSAFISLQLPVHASVSFLSKLGANARYWWPVGPVVLAALGLWWIRTGWSVSFRPGRAGSPMRRIPWMGPMLASFEAANFAELLALLLGQRVPLPEALVLCAEASDDPAVIQACRALAADLERGTAPADALRADSGLPPLLRWVLATGTLQGDLVGALRQMADLYRRRAHYLAEKLRLLLPVLLLMVIGAGAALLYALALFVPLTLLLKDLAASGP